MIHIALLTPYTGSNLGDGAIQEAVIYNTRQRFPDAEILLFTTDPTQTTRLHGLPSFPITAIHISGYSTTLLRSSSEICAPMANASSRFEFIKQRLKASRLAYRLLRVPYCFYKVFRYGIPMLVGELRHLAVTFGKLKKLDLVLVSGGGQIDDYWGGAFGHPYTLFKWSLLARMARKPVAFLSVGVCDLESRFTNFFVKQALRIAAHRSYRDQKSKDMVRQFSFTKADWVFPDLAFSFPKERRKSDRTSTVKSTQPIVGVSPIAYLSSFDWPRKELTVFERYLDNLRSFALALLQKGATIILFATDAPDKKVVSVLRAQLQNELPPDKAQQIREVAPETVDELFSEFQQMDYVVASRLHGIILAHLALIPVLAISYDRKVDTYMEDVEQAKFNQNLRTVEEQTLMEAFQSLQACSPDVLATIRHKVDEYEGRLEWLYDHVLGLATSNPNNALVSQARPNAQAPASISRRH
jgi:polysaccharide pyruvyl transferase WcaK-like protein